MVSSSRIRRGSEIDIGAQSLSFLIARDIPFSDIQRKVSSSPDTINEGWVEVAGSRRVEPLTPLHHAVLAGRWDVVTLLVQRGADVNAAHKQHALAMTPLHLAIAGYPHYPKYEHPMPDVPPAVLLSLLSERNINARDRCGYTPFSRLMRLTYHVIGPRGSVNQRNVECGQDEHVISFANACCVRRYTPLALLKWFATRENVRMDQLKLSHVFYGNYLSGEMTWDRLMLFISLQGVDVDDIRGYLSEDEARRGPACLYNLLTNTSRAIARWEYMPGVYSYVTRRPSSLQLCAALAVKRSVPHLNVCGLKQLRLPTRLAKYVADLDEEIDREWNQNRSQITMEELNTLTW